MSIPAELAERLAQGGLIPFLGSQMLDLVPGYAVPASPEALVAKLSAKLAVPFKIRSRLTQAAQFIENFKHRKTLVALMNAAFAAPPACSSLHQCLAALRPPLIVDAWYDAAMAKALSEEGGEWSEIQGLAQSGHAGRWTACYGGDGEPRAEASGCVLYKPLGGVLPASNYLVSDSDFVEVLTVIDIQWPIPRIVQTLRERRGFLFLGYRFDDQVSRSFARQIIKRSAGPHWAVLPDEPTRMEAKFLAEQGIDRLGMPLERFAADLSARVWSNPGRA
ncbi:SIR2 family NAD-dependent protein deacylase [Niveibacterium terrae]|uniref:SIR2 family NAD-dependent protein deacylase n=1 Tax=Niveibacterium terrae TaxID=3373598 RepID=UPI003A8F73AD